MASTCAHLIFDDRGQQHALRSMSCGSLAFKFTGLLTHRDRGTPREQAVHYGRLLLRLEERALPKRLYILAFVILTAAAIITLLIFTLVTGGAKPFSVVGAIWTLLTLIMLCEICFPRWARHRIARARRSLPQVCLACTYDLTGLRAEADGCTVCPECAAAWWLSC